MGPLAGVMVTDYYIIKGRKLNIHAMYEDGPSGIYWYTGGFNLRAIAAFCIAVGPLMPGFAKSIDTSLDVGDAWTIYSFAWIYGFTTASLSYYVINKWVWPQTVSIIEEAVLPPQKGEISTEEGEVTDGKVVAKVEVAEKESESA
jgi:cytosine/uracil/thiamine/allantoin permease